MPALFRIFLCLVFYLEVSIKLWKIAVALYIKSLKYLFTFTDFLLFLTQQWIHFHRISLSGDIKLNSGAKQDINQCFWVCCWNLNGVASHNLSKGHCFCFFFLLQKLDIVFLSYLCKYFQGPAEDDCLIIRPFYANIYIDNVMICNLWWIESIPSETIPW